MTAFSMRRSAAVPVDANTSKATMIGMDDSIAHPRLRAGSFELGGWRTAVSLVCAVILAGVFLASGVPKIVMPFQAAAKMMQAKIPADLSMAAAVGFGIAEVFAAVMIVVPRFRRWG